MDKGVIFCAGSTPAAAYARTFLAGKGFAVTDTPTSEARHLLLDVPSFNPEGMLRSGEKTEELLSRLAGDITVYGGNLNHPALAGYRTIDLLRDESYLAENACITAECVLDVLLPRFSGLLRGCQVLILGWGRIGKCLGQLLSAIGSEVTIAARKEKDRAMIRAMGYHVSPIPVPNDLISRYRLIINTAPEPVFSAAQAMLCRQDCLKMDLASKPGIFGPDVLWARGLPGIHRPEASGRLIAETLIRYFEKEEIS